jgi:LysR family transcriptional regulator (chromosome initiation inhibitor)
MSLIDPESLECLVALVEEGGFQRAAVRVGVSQSAISQRIRALEEQVGTVLVVRDRPLRPTAAGEVLLKHTKRLRLLRGDLERALETLKPQPGASAWAGETVSLAIHADHVAGWAWNALDRLAREGLRLELTNGDNELTQASLASGEVQGCVTTVSQPLRGCKSERLGTIDYVAVAQPGYAGRELPEGLHADNVEGVCFVAFDHRDTLAAQFVQMSSGARQAKLKHVFLPTPELRLRGALCGWGIAIVPETSARALLAQGQLVNVMPGQVMRSALYWHCWSVESQALDALGKALAGALQEARPASDLDLRAELHHRVVRQP